MNNYSEAGLFLWFWGALIVVVFLFLHFIKKFIWPLWGWMIGDNPINAFWMGNLSVDQHFWFVWSLWAMGESDLERYESTKSGFMIYHTKWYYN